MKVSAEPGFDFFAGRGVRTSEVGGQPWRNRIGQGRRPGQGQAGWADAAAPAAALAARAQARLDNIEPCILVAHI